MWGRGQRPDSGSTEQIEADLLAEGRELLERLCGSTRYRHLYPEGPSLALLFEAYQELDRRTTVGLTSPRPGPRRRALRRLLRRQVRRDALDRNRRLSFRMPSPRLIQLESLPSIVRRAIAAVDPDAREDVKRHILGQSPTSKGAPMVPVAQTDSTAVDRLSRGLTQFRDALINEALSSPGSILGLHPQYLWLAASDQPKRRHHPIATFLLVRLPLHIVLALLTLFNVAYIGAYFFFNDEVLGAFVSSRVSNLLDGDLDMRSIHWEGRLIFDLLTGTPTPVVVEDVDVWEPYANIGGTRERRAVHADRVEATIVLHEIIPWNRLGVPPVFDIPWVLHFPEVHITDGVWFDVRQYTTTDAEGNRVEYLGLIDAFRPKKGQEFPADKRGLSFEVGKAQVDGLDFTLDFLELGDWMVHSDFETAQFSLLFEAPDPALVKPVELPFAFGVQAQDGKGELQIGEVDIPFTGFDLEHFHTGHEQTPLGDIGFAGAASIDGSPVQARGSMEDALTRRLDPDKEPLPVSEDASYGELTSLRVDVATPDVGGLAARIVRELELPPDTVLGDGAPATATIEGPLTDPTYQIAAQGLTLDLVQEPAWAADDVDVSLTMGRVPIPPRWTSRFEPDAIRMVAQFDTARGAALDGSFQQQPYGEPTTIVFPEAPDEGWLISTDLQLSGVNPGRLILDDRELAGTLAGSVDGRLGLKELVFGPADTPPNLAIGPGREDELVLRRAELELEDLRLVRDRGPARDNIPKVLRMNGTVAIDDTGRLDLEDLVVGVEGGRLRADGAVTGDSQAFKDLLLDVRIDNGAAFARAFDLPTYFDKLRAQMTLLGPLAAPSGADGFVSIAGREAIRKADAQMWMEDGVLHVRAPDAELFGGRGSVSLDIELFASGGPTGNPRVRAKVALEDIELAELAGSSIRGTIDLEAEVGDGEGNMAPLSEARVDGVARAARLVFAGTTYRDATLAFGLTAEELHIARLVLPIHRHPSPLHAPEVTVPSGAITADGTVSLEDDPRLDLLVEADGVGLDVVARLLEAESPLSGEIARGTSVTVGGRLSQPSAEGKVALQNLAASGLALGDGVLDITSTDYDADGPLAAHRELRVRGELARSALGKGTVPWTVDAIVAFGAKDPRTDEPVIEAELDIRLEEIELANLLYDPFEPKKKAPIEGRIQGVLAHVLTCSDTASAMLSECIGVDPPPGEARSLAIDLAVDDAWVRGTGGRPIQGSPCDDASSICASSRLVANLEWPVLRLDEPWTLTTGGTTPVDFEVRGSFDLSDPPKKKAARVAETCLPPSPDANPSGAGSGAAGAAGGRGDASFVGTVDLDVLAPILEPFGVEMASGMVDVNLDVEGHALDPRLSGSVALNPASSGLEVGLAASPVPLRFPDLTLRMVGGWLTAAGELELKDAGLEFGTVRGEHTGYALVGPCEGTFAVATRGTVTAGLLAALGAEEIATAGAVDLEYLHVRGVPDSDGDYELEEVEGSLSLTDQSLTLALTDGLPPVELTRGQIDFQRCGAAGCGAGSQEGWIALWVGGPGTSGSFARPDGALRARIGPRGEALAWGRAVIDPDLSSVADADMAFILDSVPYRDFSSRGQLAFELEIGSRNVKLVGGTPLILVGDVVLERARYAKDAVEGVEILRLTDDVEAPSAPPPEVVRNLQFDLRAQTGRPLRVENNIASGLEADAEVQVGGTYDHPELRGRLDFEPGGRVDIPFLTGTYQLQRGRITFQPELEDSEVDVLALREQPIYIDNQPRPLQLLLTGTLAGIKWDCIANGGDVSGNLDTVRGCTEYLVLGAGDVQESDVDVQRFGGGGGLSGARRSLSVVGHLTEVDVTKRIDEAAPRFEPYLPDVRLRLGQIGPEFEVRTPDEWFDFNYGRATLGWDYTRGYPGFLLRQSREITFQLEILDPITLEFSRRIRDYLNERIIFDPLRQSTIELRFDFSIPSLR